MAWLLGFLILAALLILAYTVIQYIRDPKRKLEHAHRKDEFFLLDDPDNVRKNFFITYKGVMFEGEKYVGSTDQSLEVVTITMGPKNTERLRGLYYEDFLFIEKEIHAQYPHAEIQWQNPVKELLRRIRKK